MIKQIADKKEKTAIARSILEALPEWFEVEQGREELIAGSADQIFFAAFDGEKCVGFLTLKETGKDTVELAVTGVLKEYHRKGLGRQLFEVAKQTAANEGYSFLQVKTVKMGVWESYDKTNLFYKSLGFKEFEVIESIWDEANPCQIYVMSL